MRANLPDYRTKEEEKEWIERDPIVRFGHDVVEKKAVTPMKLKELEQAVELSLDTTPRLRVIHGRPAIDPVAAELRARYAAASVDDTRTLATIAALRQISGRLIDPHTAVALAAAQDMQAEARGAVVVLSTAHPAKFPDAVRAATGAEPALPPRLAGLYEGVERVAVLGHDLAQVRDFILDRLGAHGR